MTTETIVFSDQEMEMILVGGQYKLAPATMDYNKAQMLRQAIPRNLLPQGVIDALGGINGPMSGLLGDAQGDSEDAAGSFHKTLRVLVRLQYRMLEALDNKCQPKLMEDDYDTILDCLEIFEQAEINQMGRVEMFVGKIGEEECGDSDCVIHGGGSQSASQQIKARMTSHGEQGRADKKARKNGIILLKAKIITMQEKAQSDGMRGG